MSNHWQQTPSRTEQQDAHHDRRVLDDGIPCHDDWIAIDSWRSPREPGEAGMQPVARYVHRDGLVEAATFDDGRAPAYFVVGQPQAFPTATAAREVLARAH